MPTPEFEFTVRTRTRPPLATAVAPPPGAKSVQAEPSLDVGASLRPGGTGQSGEIGQAADPALPPAALAWRMGGVVHEPVGALDPYARNPRIHSDKQIGMLARAIREFGFVTPILVGGLVGGKRTIVAGHARYAAALEMGLTHVPTVRLDHLNAAQVKACRIADNKLAELSKFSESLLRLEFEELAALEINGEIDFELSVIGFETAELDVILDGAAATADPQEIVELPAPDTTPVSQLGDVWVLGPHRVLCGDALASSSYTALMAGEKARMVFTDPPYNVPIVGHVRTGGRTSGRTSGDGGGSSDNGHREFAMASGEMSRPEFGAFLSQALACAIQAVVDGGVLMVCMDWRHIADLIAAGQGQGLRLINLCVWNKTNGGMGSLWRSKHELVAVFKAGTAPHVNNVELGRHGRYRTNVWDYAGVNTFRRGRAADLAAHPTTKPAALVADAIRDVSHRGEIVLDAFGGSGSTLLAAERTGRRARLIELDPLYVDVAVRRWQALTGQHAVLAGTGETFGAREATAGETAGMAPSAALVALAEVENEAATAQALDGHRSTGPAEGASNKGNDANRAAIVLVDGQARGFDGRASHGRG